jgi:mannose-6-phosphate isomerase-like protein (cupin superfamily)
MHTYLPAGTLSTRPSGTIAFEGEAHGSGVSIFLVNAAPGAGPVLHRHPYSETWIMRAGRAAFVAGEATLEAGPGDILVVGPETPHKFTSLGPERLDLICIHDSPRFVQVDLE